MVLAHIAGVPVEEALFATPGLLAGAGALAVQWRARRSGAGMEGTADGPRLEALAPARYGASSPFSDANSAAAAREETPSLP